jgi:hypothetical protein
MRSSSAGHWCTCPKKTVSKLTSKKNKLTSSAKRRMIRRLGPSCALVVRSSMSTYKQQFLMNKKK